MGNKYQLLILRISAQIKKDKILRHATETSKDQKDAKTFLNNKELF